MHYFTKCYKYVLLRLTLLIFCLCMIISGCRKDVSQKNEPDLIIYNIEERVKHPDWPDEVRQRANTAISQWKNGRVDPKPILINACLVSFVETKQTALALLTFAECADSNSIIGFSIEESHIMPDGQKQIIKEDYPCLIHAPFSEVVRLWGPAVQIRKKGMRKDEQKWEEYVKGDYDEMIKKFMKSDEFLEHGSKNIVSVWNDLLPTVLISIPEPNKVDVMIWVYDKEGNESEPIKLLNRIKHSREKTEIKEGN